MCGLRKYHGKEPRFARIWAMIGRMLGGLRLYRFVFLAMSISGLFAAELDPVVLYKGTDPFPLNTYDQPGIPFVSLSDFCRAMEYELTVTEELQQVAVFNRLITFEPHRQIANLGWKTVPVQIRLEAGTAFIRVDSMINAFSEVIGKDLIYEPTSRTIHLPDDRDLLVTIRNRWNEGHLRVSVAFNKRVEKPTLHQSGRFLVLSVKYPHVQIDSTRFATNEAVEAVSVFGNLPDKTSEIHFKLGETVTSFAAEPFVATNSELVIKVAGDFQQNEEKSAELFPDQVESEQAGVRRIVIDPGHGGKDIGAKGPTGLEEKMTTLDIARKLQRYLETSGEYEVLLTRNDDFNLPLKVRTGVANNFKADLFLSIHVNAIVRPDAWGSETYYLSLDEQDDFVGNGTVEFENRETEADETVEEDEFGSDLDLLLWDLAQSEHVDDSFRVARYIQEELNILAGIRNRGVKQAPLKVLKGAAMPAVLIEVAFISNPSEERKLKSYEFKTKVVTALGRAIKRYDRDVKRRSMAQQAVMSEDNP